MGASGLRAQGGRHRNSLDTLVAVQYLWPEVGAQKADQSFRSSGRPHVVPPEIVARIERAARLGVGYRGIATLLNLQAVPTVRDEPLGSVPIGEAPYPAASVDALEWRAAVRSRIRAARSCSLTTLGAH